jgi:CubicO group peptidase (beta-lactamase class C family)
VIEHEQIDAACRAQADRQTAGIDDMERYVAGQVADASHREISGPLLAGSGASGVVLCDGELVGRWGDPDVPEMLFSATKSFVSLVAGVAFDQDLLNPEQAVSEVIDCAELADGGARTITWEHLLQQRSGWDGVLWGKPSSIDAQSQRDGPTAAHSQPGTQWAYNDVRVNLLCLALTALFGRSLEEVLREAVMGPLGASRTWRWHGYANSEHDRSPVVVGGAHWGGGLFINAQDLALAGELCRNHGRTQDAQLISVEWCERQWAACPLKPDYGYPWWLNQNQTVFPDLPESGVCARGNGGRHLLWIDPTRRLVIASHWGDEITRLINEVSNAITFAA